MKEPTHVRTCNSGTFCNSCPQEFWNGTIGTCWLIKVKEMPEKEKKCNEVWHVSALTVAADSKCCKYSWFVKSFRQQFCFRDEKCCFSPESLFFKLIITLSFTNTPTLLMVWLLHGTGVLVERLYNTAVPGQVSGWCRMRGLKKREKEIWNTNTGTCGWEKNWWPSRRSTSV